MTEISGFGQEGTHKCFNCQAGFSLYIPTLNIALTSGSDYTS